MFKSLFTKDSLRVVSKSKKTETRGRKSLSKRQRVLNFYQKGRVCNLENFKKQI